MSEVEPTRYIDVTNYSIILFDCLFLEETEQYELMLTLTNEDNKKAIIHTGIVEDTTTEIFARIQQLNGTGLFNQKLTYKICNVWDIKGERIRSFNWDECLQLLEGEVYSAYAN